MLRHDLIQLPVVRCEFRKMNAKYQMYLRLCNCANRRNCTSMKVRWFLAYI